MRLAKYIAASGYCSRRQASRLIEAGQVLVNQMLGTHILHVTGDDQVFIGDTPLFLNDEKMYWLYNKPEGINSVCRPEDPQSIMHHMPEGPRVFPVGRLDKDSHGLMLLTNDGELCHRLLHPAYYHEKEYRVRINRPVTLSFCETMSKGVQYRHITTRTCKVFPTGEDEFHITLTQGLNRQIRRMCQALGATVIELQRVRMLNLLLEQLPSNKARFLTSEEKDRLLQMMAREQ